jgi:hypothetical protein
MIRYNEIETVEGGDYRPAAGSYLQDGVTVTKKTALDTRGGEIRTGRATFPAPGGRTLSGKHTRGLSAVSAPSTRMNPSGWNMKKDAQSRRVTRSILSPAALAERRAGLARYA